MRYFSYKLVAAISIAATFLYWLNREPVSTTTATPVISIAEQIRQAHSSSVASEGSERPDPPKSAYQEMLQLQPGEYYQDIQPQEVLPAPSPLALGILSELPPRVTSPYAIRSPEYSNWAEDRIDELDQLSATKDLNAKLQLLSEVRNPDGNIREAAFDSLRLIRDRDTIPYLGNLADATTDPAILEQIVELIEFLEMETLTEYLENKRN